MAVTLSLFAGAGAQFLDNNGVMLSGGLVYTYAAGTTTPLAAYTSNTGDTALANPIVLNASGRVPTGEIWLTYGQGYKFTVKTSTGTLIGTYDNIPSAALPPLVNNAVSIAYEQGASVTAGNFIIGQTYLITFIGTTNFQSIGAVSNTVGIYFTATGVGSGTGTAEVSRTVEAKLQETISVKDFGAVGDGVTDDTAAIQAALDSGVGEVIFPAGGTYLVDGGLLVTTVGQRVSANGATIKLKANAGTKFIIRSNAAYVVFDGGTYDGNKANGNSSGSTFDSWSIAMYADNCTTQNVRSINQYGIGIKGFGNYLSVLYSRISNTENYGIFFDGSASVSHTGNRAIGNTIDMSEGQVSGGQNQGQGILFTAGSGQAQTAWELADNNIIGPQTSVVDQAINLGVRGNSGIVSNNTTRYGAMGFSEGGANTVISGNRFLNLVGSTRYGVEPSGGNTVITGNVITDAIRGVSASGTITFDGLVITGNKIQSSNFGVILQIDPAYTGHNCVISGNNITFGGYGVYTTRDVRNLQVSSNVLVGPSNTFASGRGVYIDTPPTDAYVYVTANTITDVQRPYAVYSAGALTVNYLFATNNNLSLAGLNTNSSIWTVEGLAALGATVISANNINPAAIGLEYSAVNQGSNIVVRYGIGTPEGAITAGVGSIYVNKSGGVATTLYVKATGTGNTGWTALS
jgi:hypothetical protein